MIPDRQPHFYPKREEFPDDILCYLCVNYKDSVDGNCECKTLLAMNNDMEEKEGGIIS